MKLFSKPTSYLGVDIGSSSLKIVELVRKDNSPRLVTYGYSEESTDIIKGKSFESQMRTAAVLKAVCQKARVSTKKVLAALPNFFVFSSIINLPSATPAKELDSAINWEAKKFVPVPLNEVVLKWKILTPEEQLSGAIISASKKPEPLPAESDKSQDNSVSVSANVSEKNEEESAPQSFQENKPANGGLNVLLTAAPKDLVKKYLDIFAAAGLELLSLETESFALARALVGHNLRPAMLIDMGALVSDIVVMEKGIPVLSRSIDIGGDTITQSIMKILNVNVQRAEQFKRDFGAPLSFSPIYSPGQKTSAAPAFSNIPRVIASILNSLVSEVRYSINLYQNQTSKKIEKVILSGGSAFLPNFTDYLSQTLSLPVFIGNPWDRVSYPAELKPALEALAPRFAVAIGLALREVV